MILPDRSGLWDATDDSRLSFDMSDPALRGVLLGTHSAIILGVGNPTLHQDTYNERDGANFNNGIFGVFGNQSSNSPGFAALDFNSYGRPDNAFNFKSRFTWRFVPNGGSQASLRAISEPVTLTNCAYVVVQRTGDDYAVHLYDKLGNKTAGTAVTHDLNSLGATFRGTAYTVFLGGKELTIPSVAGQQRAYTGQLENFILLEQAVPFIDFDDKVKAIIQGASAVTEFGAAAVKVYRTLKDLSPASLSAVAAANLDVFPALVNPATSRSIVGSPLGAVNNVLSASIDEFKYNFAGVLATETTGTINLTGTFIGAATSIECRVLHLDDLSEEITWTTVDASPAGGVWQGQFTNVPLGEYCIECRPGNAPLTVFEGRNPWVVAYVFMWVGQSQMEIAFNTKTETLTLPDSVPAGFKSYVLGVNRNTGQGFMPYLLRPQGDLDFSDGLRYAQIEWERKFPGTPIVWVELCVFGSSVNAWVNNLEIASGYDFFGDQATFLSGHVTDMKLLLRTAEANPIICWGTSDLTNVDYEDQLKGYLVDAGINHTGPGFSHLTDLFNPNMPIGLTPLTRSINSTADNFTADPVSDDELNVASFRENQPQILADINATEGNVLTVGPSVCDMLIETQGGPHPPPDTEGLTPYLGGGPRLGARVGITAAHMVLGNRVLPTLAATGRFNEDKTAFTIRINPGSYGAIINAEDSTVISGFELSEDAGAVFNRKGFTVTLGANRVTVTRDSGNWSALAEGALRWRYHSGGPYSYGLDFTAEMRADIDRALYATSDEENGRGIPVTQSTNSGDGNQVIEAAADGETTQGYIYDNGAYRRFKYI